MQDSCRSTSKCRERSCFKCLQIWSGMELHTIKQFTLLLMLRDYLACRNTSELLCLGSWSILRTLLKCHSLCGFQTTRCMHPCLEGNWIFERRSCKAAWVMLSWKHLIMVKTDLGEKCMSYVIWLSSFLWSVCGHCRFIRQCAGSLGRHQVKNLLWLELAVGVLWQKHFDMSSQNLIDLLKRGGGVKGRENFQL